MLETPFFFPNKAYKLFGVLHEPLQNNRNFGFVFIHPFAEEKLWAHRILVNFARFLARDGFTILRFDFMGHGDSEGEFQDSSVETRLSDIEAALLTLKTRATRVEKYGLLGLRFGATMAALAADKLNDIDTLILWEPVIEGDKYMQQILRSNLATQNAVYKEIRHTREQLIEILKEGKTINFDGYQLAFPFYKQISEINLLSDSRTFQGRTLIIQIEKNPKKPSQKHTTLKENYNKADQCMATAEPFWKETKYFCSQANDLYNNTYDWLLNHGN